MRDLADMPADDVLREYFAERRRREHPPSLAGMDPDAPKPQRGRESSGRWEQLIALTRGCDGLILDLMYEASGQWTRHEQRPVLAADGNPILAQGQPITEPVAVPMSPVELARIGRVLDASDIRRLKRALAEVIAQVAVNQGRMRQEATKARATDPLERVRALAARVLRRRLR